MSAHGVPIDDPVVSAGESARLVGELILRVARELDEMFVVATADEGLDPFEARLLAAAVERGPQSSLAARLGTDASRVSTVTAHLERRGFVRRVASRGDRRVRHAELTADGARALERIGQRLIVASPLISKLGENERTMLIELLERVVG